jgi:hypothetical protein
VVWFVCMCVSVCLVCDVEERPRALLVWFVFVDLCQLVRGRVFVDLCVCGLVGV